LERKNAELLEIQDVYTTVQLENENLVRACQTLGNYFLIKKSKMKSF